MNIEKLTMLEKLLIIRFMIEHKELYFYNCIIEDGEVEGGERASSVEIINNKILVM
jgi:hypothetical protein